MDDAPVLGPDGHLTEGGAHAFVDGALGDEDAARVIAHVAACARCAGVVAEARGLAAASTRILSALDDVPAGVVPVGAAPLAAVSIAAPPAAMPHDGAAAAARPAAARRARWAGWPVRAAAGVLLAVGVGSAVWRGQGPSAPEAAGALPRGSESVASAPLASAAPAAPVPTASAAASAAESAAASAAAATSAVSSVDAGPAVSRGRAENASGDARPAPAQPPSGRAQFAPSVGALQVATAESPAAGAASAEATPPPAAPPPAPVAEAPAAALANDAAMAGASAERRAGVAARAQRTTRPDVPTADSALVRPGAGCYVLVGAPALADGSAPGRVTLEPDGDVLPRPESLAARWQVRGDTLALVWRRGKGRKAPRAELRLGPEGGDGVLRGVARGFDGAERGASARPVRCDGGLR